MERVRRRVAVVAFAVVIGASAVARGTDELSVERFRRDYRAAHERQTAATKAVKVSFHRAREALPMPPGAGEARPAVVKTPEQVEKERERELQIEANNRLMRMDLTYYRAADRERLDIRGVDPRVDKEWTRSIVGTNEGSFSAMRKPGAGEYALEFYERGRERASNELMQGQVFVDAARRVGAEDVADLVLGEGFEIVRIRSARSSTAAVESDARAIVEIRRIKPPGSGRITRHVVRGTLTFEPAHEYRLVGYELETSDGFVARCAVEYGETSGPRALIPSKVVEEVSKAGETHRGVGTFTLKDVSFDEPQGSLFRPEAFGIDVSRPAGASLSPQVPAALGVALVVLGVVLYARRPRDKAAGRGRLS